MQAIIPMSEADLMRELEQIAEDCLPWQLDALPVGWPYPQVAKLSPACTVLVGESASARTH